MKTFYLALLAIGVGIAFVYWMCILAQATLAIAHVAGLPDRGSAKAMIFVWMLSSSVAVAAFAILTERMWP
jgi:hypothetical protein